MTSAGIIKSVNWHITSKCNYSCRFCFTRYLSCPDAEIDRARKLLPILYTIGIEKINFVGGEPLLHPGILQFCRLAKDIGFIVSITTNGSLLDSKSIAMLRDYVDWIGLSVDSNCDEVERSLGRGWGRHVTHCIRIADRIHEASILLKMNTTLTQLNYQENLRPIVRCLDPERWKVFQYLPITDQNTPEDNDLSIRADQFQEFVALHQHVKLSNGDGPIFESSDDMVGSYFMLNYAGNVLVNDGMKYTELPFNEVVKKGLEVIINKDKYLHRGAIYPWKGHFRVDDDSLGGAS